MCTVSFIPTPNGIFLSSNRDEHKTRGTAIKPRSYTSESLSVLYPKDAKAGGTWIALNSFGDAAVLLNGAFQKHTPAIAYRKSRGLIFLEIISGNNPKARFDAIDLNEIEPFTLILFSEGILYELRWDSFRKYQQLLNTSHPHIWSSSTLYDAATINKREQWFEEWLSKNLEPTLDQILMFHKFGGEGDRNIDIRMNRNNELFTVSITSIELNRGKGLMHYQDLINQDQSKQEIDFHSSKELISQHVSEIF
ncbi:MAG: NRDE family protein [Chitinophagaceae bacterium]|nr:NRDE family protein [Chitinophagaceae bacterium]